MTKTINSFKRREDFLQNNSGAPAARRAAQQNPIDITGKKRKPMKDFPYGYHG